MESITTTLQAHDGSVRLAIFAALLVVLGVAERVRRRRALTLGRGSRWYGNLGLSAINSLVSRLAFPLLALGAAEVAQQRGWGLFNLAAVPYLIGLVASFVMLDLVIYAQHRVFHRVPLLWRLHRVHHSDVDLDVSTAVRFHLLESVLSMGVKLGAVVALGAPVLAVLAFEVWLNAVSMFHHSNLAIPPRVDRVLRWFVVTPDMHRVHHSVLPEETNSNYAFNLPWWDRLFGTYRAQPKAGHQGMTIGVESFRTPRDQQLHRLLLQPFFDGDRGPGSRVAPGLATDPLDSEERV